MYVYAGAGSHNTMIHPDAFEGAGLMASRDGGATWINIAGEQFKDGAVVGLAVAPDDAQVVYAATQMGLFMTTDGGATWSSPDELPEQTAVRSVAIDPRNSQKVLAGVDTAGLYVSTDGGTSWSQVSAGLELIGSYRSIVFDPTNSQIVYLGDLYSGVYRSTDGGLTWLKINNGLSTRAVTNLSLSSDGDHLYAATNGEGVFRLDLNGQPPAPAPDLEPAAPTTTSTTSGASSPTPEQISEPGICGSVLLLPLFIFGVVWLRGSSRKDNKSRRKGAQRR
ncbi:MAG: YCF48-related protein [Chloroflexota bacterium]